MLSHSILSELNYVSPTKLSVNELESAKIICRSINKPKWTFNDDEPLPMNAIMDDHNFTILNIYTVTRDNAGIYYCHGKTNRDNETGTFYSFIQLQVQSMFE